MHGVRRLIFIFVCVCFNCLDCERATRVIEPTNIECKREWDSVDYVSNDISNCKKERVKKKKTPIERRDEIE